MSDMQSMKAKKGGRMGSPSTKDDKEGTESPTEKSEQKDGGGEKGFPIDILIVTLRGYRRRIEVMDYHKVADLKKRVETIWPQFPAKRQMLIHEGSILKDNTTLRQNRIGFDSLIYILLTKPVPVLFTVWSSVPMVASTGGPSQEVASTSRQTQKECPSEPVQKQPLNILRNIDKLLVQELKVKNTQLMGVLLKREAGIVELLSEKMSKTSEEMRVDMELSEKMTQAIRVGVADAAEVQVQEGDIGNIVHEAMAHGVANAAGVQVQGGDIGNIIPEAMVHGIANVAGGPDLEEKEGYSLLYDD
ncbi:OLC1v1038010C1 [Oldenlandia corymbosa var. corymbosa]|uniref:OLC1v1038010C1 n=1 Tax=Oldenlandia corymbosa var. corymbosa TaxID=529605 RepID=A0AAV1CYX8_OLDCO|nr:OLC1v1038010C1 [Oldenlandia corymbosa var. corymbosa]